MLTPAPACWLCSMPVPTPQNIPVHRWKGWWAMSERELRAIELAHVGLRVAFTEVRPTDALMATCYDALRRHGIPTLAPAK